MGRWSTEGLGCVVHIYVDKGGCVAVGFVDASAGAACLSVLL